MNLDWLNMEQLDALAEWEDLQEWQADPCTDEKPPWMHEPCPAPADRRQG